jgi:hypothetical protein
MKRLAPRTPLQVGVVSMLGALGYVMVHIANVGSLGAFVTAGSTYTDATKVTGGIPVLAGNGYDGQFFYRLALSPLKLSTAPVHGIAFDNVFRAGRIGYPLLAALLSGGQTGEVPLALVAVNILAIGCVGIAGARLAMMSGRAAAWGLCLAGYFGFAFTLSRDLSEIVVAAAVCGALVLLRQRRYLAASVPLAVAVLTREQAVLTVVSLAAGAAVMGWRSNAARAAARRLVEVAALPAAVFVAWQIYAARTVGIWPARASSDEHAGLPFTNMPSAMWRWAQQAVGTEWRRFALVLFVVLVVLAVGAIAGGGIRSLWSTQPGEVLLGIYAVLVFTAFYGRVDDPAYFRQAYELAIVSWLALFAGRREWLTRVAVVVLPLSVVTIAARALIV